MADKAAHISAKDWDKDMLLGHFLSTIAAQIWDLLATTTAARDFRIESRVASSLTYDQITLEYRKLSPSSTSDIAFSEVLAYPTV